MAGIPRSTEVIAPLVEVEAQEARRRAKAETGSILKVKGRSRTRPIAPPSPGIAPIMIPTRQPRKK